MNPALVGFFWPTAIFVVLLRSGDYPITSIEALIAFGIVGLVGALLGLLLNRFGGGVRKIAYAGLLTFMCNALYRPYPELQVFGASTDLVIPVLIFAGAISIITLFRSDADTLVATVLGAAFIGAFFTTPLYDDSWTFESELLPPVAQAGLPPYIHIVLDGHLGFEQLPNISLEGKADKSRYLDLYLSRGFYVHGNVYVNYTNTNHSFSNFLSYGETIRPPKPVESKDFARHNLLLNPNNLFASLRSRGYKLSVVRSTHLDLCSDNEGRGIVDKCNVYPFSPLTDSIVGSNLPIRRKVAFLINNIFQRTGIVALVNRVADTNFGQAWGLPTWPFRTCLHCISSETALATVVESLPNLKPGHALFLHLILPHGPFQTYDAHCTPRILPSYNPGAPTNYIKLYMGQVECTQRTIISFIDLLMTTEIGNKSFVVIHGDHGVRNREINVSAQPLNLDEFDVTTDKLGKAAHSTFVAVRSPKRQPYYSNKLISLNEALSDVVNELSRSNQYPQNSVEARVESLLRTK